MAVGIVIVGEVGGAASPGNRSAYPGLGLFSLSPEARTLRVVRAALPGRHYFYSAAPALMLQSAETTICALLRYGEKASAQGRQFGFGKVGWVWVGRVK